MLEWSRGLRLTLALLAVAAALAASLLGGDRGLLRVRALRAELAVANDENFALMQEIERLRRQVHDVRTDDTVLERLARRRLSLAREGETIYQLQPARRAGPTGADAASERP